MFCSSLLQKLKITLISYFLVSCGNLPKTSLDSLTISISESPTIAVGTNLQFTAQRNLNNTVLNSTNGVNWTSSNEAVATIDEKGLMTGIAVGTATISATLNTRSPTGSNSKMELPNLLSNPYTITITPATLVSLSLTASLTSLPKGLTTQYKATGIFSDASTQNMTSSVSWSSSNTASATISALGLVVGVGVGNSTISASFQNITATSNLTVIAASLTSIAITPTTPNLLGIGRTQQFTASGTFSDNSTLDLSSLVSWTSTTSAVTLSATGLATGASVGSSQIIASLFGVTSNTVSLSTRLAYALVMQNGSGPPNIQACALNVNGTFASCSDTGVNSSGTLLTNPMTQINVVGNYVYMTNNTNSTSGNIVICSINSSAQFSSCNNTTTAAYVRGLASSGSFTYITDWTNALVKSCSINTNGSLGSCFTQLNSGLSNPNRLQTNGNYLFISDGGSSNLLKSCLMNADGTLSNCNSASGTNFNNPIGVYAVGNYMYVSSCGNGTVSQCSYTGGSLTSCTPIGGFSCPNGLSYNNGYLYVVNGAANQVLVCTIGTGTLSCQNAGIGIASPTGITIY